MRKQVELVRTGGQCTFGALSSRHRVHELPDPYDVETCLVDDCPAEPGLVHTLADLEQEFGADSLLVAIMHEYKAASATSTNVDCIWLVDVPRLLPDTTPRKFLVYTGP